MRLTRYVLTTLVIVTLAIAVYLLYLISPTQLSGEEIRIVVPLDTSQEKVIAQLKEERLIRNDALFTFIASMIKFPGTIEPGAYKLRRNQTMLSVADTLMKHPYQLWIVLTPGLRKEQVAERIAKKFNWDGTKTKEFLATTKEGYLFPDTYLFSVDWTAEQVAKRMIDNFNEKFDAKLQADLLSQNVKNDTAIKIASLIERESAADDKALISGIIWNRLNKGMKLDIDATIQYAIGTSRDWWPRLQTKDMKYNSLYNTYVYKGLPPGPIANPSLASITAAIYPEETDCLYYLHDLNKQIHCAKTYEEHKDNIEKYLR